MADKKITALSNITGANLANTDEFVVVDISADETKAVTRAEFFKSTPPVDVSGSITLSGTVDGRNVATDGTKLDGIEALADKTDTANVTAAGALMDSELTNIAAIKALNQGVATTNSPTFVTVNSTTSDMTNLEVTNIKAKDGTSSATIANTTGVMTVASSVLTTTDINGGTVDNTIIGGSVPNAITGTTLTATGPFTSLGIDDNATSTAIKINDGGFVGIGTVTPSTPLEIVGSGQSLTFTGATSGATGGSIYKTSLGVTAGIIDVSGSSGDIQIKSDPDNVMANSSILMQVDGGTVLSIEPNLTNVTGDVILLQNGTTTTGERRLAVRSLGYAVLELSGDRSDAAGEVGGAGMTMGADGIAPNAIVSYVNAAGTDGVGGTYTDVSANQLLIGTTGNPTITFGTNSIARVSVTAGAFRPTASDGTYNLGSFANRFATVYASTGTINTSDETTKQDIDVLSEAETRVALTCKGLMRKFRFIDAVEKKGEDARIHFGIIAQDLQGAFIDEGLDPNRYAMFCSDTWWEEDIVIPAFADAPETTQRKVYDTAEEATETATKVTRLGVRYSELLAFIIGAM